MTKKRDAAPAAKKLSIDVDSLGRDAELQMNAERRELAKAPERFKAGDAVEGVDPGKLDLGD